MKFFSVEKLAELCEVDRETIRRWRNRGVNGVKLQARQTELRRGVPLMFDEDAVRTFMQSNPKYLTKKLDDALNVETGARTGMAVASAQAPAGAAADNSYVRQLLEQQRRDLQEKLRAVEAALEQLK